MCARRHLPDKLPAMRTEGGLTQKRGHELVPIHLVSSKGNILVTLILNWLNGHQPDGPDDAWHRDDG